jgi:hypothetical protein
MRSLIVGAVFGSAELVERQPRFAEGAVTKNIKLPGFILGRRVLFGAAIMLNSRPT